MSTPTLEEVKEHFAKAKEIICLKLKIKVDVSSVSNFTFSEADNSWSAIGGVICFWKDGQYSQITKKKCNPADCLKCKECAEKRKQLKK